MWEAILELEPDDADADPENPGAATMLIDLQRAFDKVQMIVVWNFGMYFEFPVFLLRHVGVGIFRTSSIVVFEGSVEGPVQAYTAMLPGGKFSVVLLRMESQDDMRAVLVVLKVYGMNEKLHRKWKKKRQKQQQLEGKCTNN